jgi:hypothetical protein
MVAMAFSLCVIRYLEGGWAPGSDRQRCSTFRNVEYLGLGDRYFSAQGGRSAAQPATRFGRTPP